VSPAKNLGVSIDLDAQRAYDFLARPENFPQWASGLADSLRKVGGEWQAQTPEGPARVRFSERNQLGVLDHWVYLASGAEIYIPLRLIRNGDGCELVLTIFRRPGATDEQFAADGAWVMRDLNAAKKLLEGLFQGE
jgi:hypothetical protein